MTRAPSVIKIETNYSNCLVPSQRSRACLGLVNTAEGNWWCLFEYTTTFLEEWERDEEIQDCNKIEYYHERLETVFRCVYRLHEHCAGALMHPEEFLLTATECTIVRELDSGLIALMNTLSSVYFGTENGLEVLACQHLCMSHVGCMYRNAWKAKLNPLG